MSAAMRRHSVLLATALLLHANRGARSATIRNAFRASSSSRNEDTLFGLLIGRGRANAQGSSLLEITDRDGSVAVASQASAVETKTSFDGPFDRVLDKVNEHAERVKEATQQTQKILQKAIEKPVMQKINILRTKMCWKRHNLPEHEPCLKFLGVVCSAESTGQGICKDFRRLAKKLCKAENEKLHDLFCSLAPELVDEEDEEADEKTGAEDKFHGDVVPANSSADPAKDSDKDVMPDVKDDFPRDPAEWTDTDGDGIGDNSDTDIDGDGMPNGDDMYPRDPQKWKAERTEEGDVDGDGVDDKEDVFPQDATEWSDLEGDGIGDNSDIDIDGDSKFNDIDAFPRNDKEWRDTDHDGHGDNSDAFPLSSDCWDETKPCNSTQVNKYVNGFDPSTVDKVEKLLPPQGYDEVARGHKVEHDDLETYTGDWRKEWPTKDESEKESIHWICAEHPDNDWCKRYHNHGRFAR